MKIDFLKRIKKEIKTDRKTYFLLLLILVFSFFFRVYRVGDLLGFYYDQGRDALKILEMIKFQDFPAIGPTTGIEGLFLGPFWFYLLAPFYFLGNGNPVVAAIAISFFDLGAIIMLFLIGREFFSKRVGLLASFFWGFSYYFICSARWFSNPSPLPFFSLLLIFSLLKFFIKKKNNYLILASLSLSLALQLEIASAIFYIPIILVLFLIFKPLKTSKKTFFASGLIFFALLIPQILFEFKNNFLTLKNFLIFSKGEINTNNKTWAIPSFAFIKARIYSYKEIFFSRLDVDTNFFSSFFSVLFLIFSILLLKREKLKSASGILLVFLVLPLILLLFFSGNYARLYDYYLTGFFASFILLFSLFASFFLKKKIYYPIFALIIIFFLNGNLIFIKDYLSTNCDKETHISLKNELQAIDWMYEDADEKFNVDVYVPPVIPLAYDYLIPYRGEKKYNKLPVEERVSLLYTIYEADPPHPERLDAWLKRQEGIGRIVRQIKFGGITVERRERL
ncbi:MAG: glycosyltransferase family 39 protein [Patescibacteria group bacterium]